MAVKEERASPIPYWIRKMMKDKELQKTFLAELETRMESARKEARDEMLKGNNTRAAFLFGMEEAFSYLKSRLRVTLAEEQDHGTFRQAQL